MGNLQDELKAALSKAGVEMRQEKPSAAIPQRERPQSAPSRGAPEGRQGKQVRRGAPAPVVPAGRDSARSTKPLLDLAAKTRPHGRDAKVASPIGLPRARNLERVDWWVKVFGPGRAQWALIQRPVDADGAIVLLIDQASGVFDRWDVSSDVDAKGRLFKAGFDRLQNKRALLGSFKPPAGPFRFTSKPAGEGSAPATGKALEPGVPKSRPGGPVPAPAAAGGPAPAAPPSPAVRKAAVVEVTGTPRTLLDTVSTVAKKLRRLRLVDGVPLQCPGRAKADEHEVTVGLDFGTSATKVVIGDSSLSKAFAVPFCAADGVAAYLLPSRVYERETSTLLGGARRSFALDQGARIHRDLKLGWLANPDSAEHRIRVVAFLALVLRHARGWLFHEHSSIYKPVKIVWRIAVGLPAASALNNQLADELRKLAQLAWSVSCTKGDVDHEAIRSAVAGAAPLDAEPQVDVVPEIAAQIYGFVTSHTFDKKAPNRYLLVDIGAGTVDSSLFRVKPARGRKWEFEFYTAVVQPHGASNLHVHRINWWQAVLSGTPQAQQVVADLERNKFATDFEGGLPDRYGDYVDGVRVAHPGEACADPDLEFLTGRVVKQVRGETVYRTWKDQLLPQSALAGIPMFLCGGGSRMPLYQRIEANLAPQPNFRWLHAERWTLGFPDDLECEAPIDEDYDRLSVAYGLSRLDVGCVIKATPMPKIESPPQAPWTDRYVDKDQM